jgi:hypothetical protein
MNHSVVGKLVDRFTTQSIQSLINHASFSYEAHRSSHYSMLFKLTDGTVHQSSLVALPVVAQLAQQIP